MDGKQDRRGTFVHGTGKARSLENVNPIPILCNPLLTMTRCGVVR